MGCEFSKPYNIKEGNALVQMSKKMLIKEL